MLNLEKKKQNISASLRNGTKNMLFFFVTINLYQIWSIMTGLMVSPWPNKIGNMTLEHSHERNFLITPAARGRCLRTGLVAGCFRWLQHPNRSKPSLSQ